MAASFKPTSAALLLCCFWFWLVSGVFHEENFPKDYQFLVSGERNLIPRGDETSAWEGVGSEYVELDALHDIKNNRNADADQGLIERNKLIRNISPDLIEKLRSKPGLRDFPCPLAAEIAPCLCTYDQDFNVDLNCTAIVSEDQLATVFQQEFPAPNLRRFHMSKNNAIKVLRNILNGITFQEIALYPGPFVLEAVSEYFLLSTKETLRSIFIQNSYLDSDSFPFYTLSALEELTKLDVYHSNMSWIPKLQGPNLMTTRFQEGFIDYIEPGTFGELPSLMTVELTKNLIRSLEAETFPIRGSDTFINLASNAIASVQPGTFYFEDENDSYINASIKINLYNNQLQTLQAGTFVFRDSFMTVYLSKNQITSIEPGAFVMPPNSTDSLSIILHLHINHLTTFDEDVFGELLPYTTELILYDNPFDCGCDVAWLVLNPFHMSKIDNKTTCRDGTYFSDLDPNAFWNVCDKSTLTNDDNWNRNLAGVMNVMKRIWGS